MMKISARAIVVLLQIVGLTGFAASVSAQPANTSQQLVFAGRQLNMLYTPAGTYQYQVTASSTGGVPQSQTVTLNLIVTGC